MPAWPAFTVRSSRPRHAHCRCGVVKKPLSVSGLRFVMALAATAEKRLAERTGLEPATPGVTGRYSNQLNYRSDLGGRML